MAKENIFVEITPPTGKGAYTGVGVGRYVQVTLGDGTVVIDGVTYTRTSPLRTTRDSGGMGPQLDLVAAGDHTSPPVGSTTEQGNGTLAIFSASGT